MADQSEPATVQNQLAAVDTVALGLPVGFESSLIADSGELRSGAWGFGPARIEDVLSVPPEHLWQRLTVTLGRLTWLAH